jgi:hypothetical protein
MLATFKANKPLWLDLIRGAFLGLDSVPAKPLHKML